MATEAILAAARAGDAAQFEQLIAPFRREIEAHCYRLTGCLADAEDAAQESLIRAWRGLGGFTGDASLRSWLHKIATNTCLTELERRPRRALPMDFSGEGDPSAAPAPPVLDPIWLDPCPESMWSDTPVGPDTRYSARESVRLAFIGVLQTLPPLQRAVVVLRDVLGYSAAEAADLLDTTVAAVNSASQRARATLDVHRERLEEGVNLDPNDAKLRSLLLRYVGAWESGDTQALVSLLREDATLTMPPMPTWYRGREVIVGFLAGFTPRMGVFRLVPTLASGAPALASYCKAPGDDRYRAQSLHVLDVGPDGLIRTMDVFVTPAVFGRFGLSDQL